MPKVKINDKEVEVKDGTLILDAAKEAGYIVPTFCYQADLSSLGSCRMCLVEIKGQRKLQPACITPVLDDMSVETNNETVSSARSAMLEFLLSNHAFDCPVCDKAGECELQDMVHKHGPHKGRHAEPKHSFHNKDYALNAVIVKNSNRCVQCQRCVRVCEEVVGRGVLGSIGRGHIQEETSFLRTYLDCDHDGMCIEVCPVGCFMRRPYRFKARPWDLKSTKTVCPYCATGCRMTIQERDGEVVRSIAMPEDGFNGKMMCARGRFGYDFLNSKGRLTTPLIKNKDGVHEPISWDKAIDIIKTRFARTAPEKIGAVASARLTNEALYLMQKLMRDVVGSGNIDSSSRWNHSVVEGFVQATEIPKGGTSIYDAMDSDAIFVLGTHVSDENPVTDYVIRNLAAANRKSVFVATPRAMKLDSSAQMVFRYKPGRLAAMLGAIVGKFQETRGDKLSSVKGLSPTLSKDLEELSKASGISLDDIATLVTRLNISEKITLMAGTELLRGGDGIKGLGLLRDTLRALGKEVLVMPILDRSNQRGAWDMGINPVFGPGYAPVEGKWKGTEEMLEAALDGDFDVLYVLGEDIQSMFPDRSFATMALSKLDFLVVQAAYMNETAKMADLILPGGSFAEKHGNYTNQEGRVQAITKLMEPPGDGKTDLDIIWLIGSALDSSFGPNLPREVFKEIQSKVGMYSEVEPTGFISADTGEEPVYKFDFKEALVGSGSVELLDVEAKDAEIKIGTDGDHPFMLLTGNHLFHSGVMSMQSELLKGLLGKPIIEMSALDAKELDMNIGDLVTVRGNGFEADFVLRIKEGTPRGVIFMPENYQEIAVNKFYERKTGIPGVNVTAQRG